MSYCYDKHQQHFAVGCWHGQLKELTKVKQILDVQGICSRRHANPKRAALSEVECCNGGSNCIIQKWVKQAAPPTEGKELEPYSSSDWSVLEEFEAGDLTLML